VIDVLIVAPYSSVRAGLRTLLAEPPDCRVIGEVGGSSDLARIFSETPAEVVLCDYTPIDGPDIVATAAENGAALVLLGDGETGYRELAGSDLPGWAYLRKEADGEEIAGAVRAVAAGLVVLDRLLAPSFCPPLPFAPPLAEESLLPDETLTPREREVIQLMAQGLPNKNIAARLSISLHTVKFHVASILAKLNANSRTEAVTQGARRGLVTL
jgi:DNA-binding NarL/FixJ family response regulator